MEKTDANTRTVRDNAGDGPKWQWHIGNKTQRRKLAVDSCLNAMGSPSKELVAFTGVVKDAKDDHGGGQSTTLYFLSDSSWNLYKVVD